MFEYPIKYADCYAGPLNGKRVQLNVPAGYVYKVLARDHYLYTWTYKLDLDWDLVLASVTAIEAD